MYVGKYSYTRLNNLFKVVRVRLCMKYLWTQIFVGRTKYISDKKNSSLVLGNETNVQIRDAQK